MSLLDTQLKAKRPSGAAGHLALAVFFWIIALNASATPPAGYYLVWGDEFNGTTLDSTKWWTWAKPDQNAILTSNAVSVGGGYMTITTYTSNGINYSAIVSSDGKFRAKYGYYESSIKFSDTPGEWSAWWIQSINEGEFIGDPSESGAEIDICEHRYSDSKNADIISDSVQTSVHWDGYSTKEKTVTSGLIGAGLDTGFHTYGFLWDPTNYSFAFDGVPMWRTKAGHSDRTEIITYSQEVKCNGWAGITPDGGYGDLTASTTKMVVDYVRYYAPTTTLFWTGASSPNWADSGNWLSNMVPSAKCDVVFGYLSLANFNATLAKSATVNSVSIQESSPVTIQGSALTIKDGGIDMLSAINNAVIASPLVLGANQDWKIGSGKVLTVTGVISGAGNLTFGGRGTVMLAATNNCRGTMSVTNGTLLINGLVKDPVTAQGGTVGGTGRIAGPVRVNAGGTLTGTGTFTGRVQVKAQGTLAPGNGIGTLVMSNSLTLAPGSVTEIDINKSAGTNDQIIGLASVTYGGTLTVSNQAGVLAARDAFKIFAASKYKGAFTRIIPPAPGTNLAWDTSTLARDGTLRVK